MGNHSMTKFDLLIETHQGLKRQGPGSPEMTLRALSFISHLDEHSRLWHWRADHAARAKYRRFHHGRGSDS